MASDEVKTDLGQLRVAQDSQLEMDWKWLERQVKELLNSARVSQNSKSDPYAAALREVPQYQPNAKTLWLRGLTLKDGLLKDEIDLGKAHMLFDLAPRFSENVRLQLDRKQSVIRVLYGPQSLIPEEVLVGLDKLSVVDLQWAEYIHQRDWPAHDEPAFQARLLLGFGERRLAFSAGGYTKMGLNLPRFQTWAARLAKQFGAKLKVCQHKERFL